jgi:hypothetical protein
VRQSIREATGAVNKRMFFASKRWKDTNVILTDMLVQTQRATSAMHGSIHGKLLDPRWMWHSLPQVLCHYLSAFFLLISPLYQDTFARVV